MPKNKPKIKADSSKKAGSGKKHKKSKKALLIEVKDSGVHGRGVYALQPIAAGKKIIEYKGEIISWEEALARHPHDPSQPTHTFYFHLDDGHVIDGKHKGNEAKWMNHSCEPNAEAEQKGDRVFLRALRDLQPGEELFFDYGLVIEGRITAAIRKDYACWCGTPSCRTTMLALTPRQLQAVRKPSAVRKSAATPKPSA